MKYFAFRMKNGDLMIESGLNLINATGRYYPNFDFDSIIELELVGTITNYPEIKETE